MKLVLLSIAASSFFGATLTSPVAPKQEDPKPISFKETVTPVLKKYCYNCHAGQEARKGLKVDTYDNIMKGTTYGKVVIAKKSADSVLVKAIKKIPGASAMPPSRRKMTETEIKIISDWIDQGAKNN
ncbi:MAG: c-type cytochrome domain-containing protein [Fimbriimonadaceae bacterium]